jgi:uncharacterized membrane protein
VFLLDTGGGNILVGFLERVAPGYAQVTYIDDHRVKHHRFVDSYTGEVQDFDSSGYRRAEWSAGTLVRPLESEDDMSETSETPLVGGDPISREDIKAKVTKMKAKASTAAAAPAGKAKAKAKGKPMSEETKKKLREAAKRSKDNDCKCGCGNKTGGTFSVGHDARYYGWLKKVAGGTMEFKELPASVRKDLVDVKGAKAALAKSKH